MTGATARVEPSIDLSSEYGCSEPERGGGAGGGWPPATTDARRCAAPGCDEVVSEAATTCSARCRQRLHRERERSYVLTDADREAVRRILASDDCPLPVVTAEDRLLVLEAAQPRVPAFTGAAVPEASVELGPGGDPAARLEALYARVGRRPPRRWP